VRDDLSLSYHSSFVFLSALPHVFMTVCNCASEKRQMNAFTLSHLSHHFFSPFGREFGILRFTAETAGERAALFFIGE
jgi:hypothetical protein